MSKKQPRQTCECGLSFRYPADFEEHKRVGCRIESGKGESLAADPDVEQEASAEEPKAQIIEPVEAEPEPLPSKKKSKKK